MQFKIYKKGQGYYTRLWTALGIFAISSLGCFSLYGSLQGFNPWVYTMVPAFLLAFFGWVSFWAVNKPNFADFFIHAETELKKVNWTSKAEIFASTKIVILVVIFMIIMIGVVDFAFRSFFDAII